MHKWRNIETEVVVETAVAVNGTLESNETAVGNSELQTSWGPYLSIASMVPNVTILLLNAAFGHHFRFPSLCSKQMSRLVRKIGLSETGPNLDSW